MATANAEDEGASAAPAAPASLAEELAGLRARDRFAAPAGELAAWEDFIRRADAAPDAPADLRADGWRGVAIARYYAKDAQGGLAAATTARTLLAGPGGTGDPAILSELLSYTALLLIDLDRKDEAAALIDQAETLARGRGDAGRADLALSYNVRALWSFSSNDLPAAERLFCDARDLTMQVLSPTDPMITTNATSCATLKYFLERPDTMIAARAASNFAMAHLPPDHPRMGLVLNSSYALLTRLGRYLEAEPLIRRHLDLERALYDKPVDDVFDPLTMLARTLAATGKLEEAEALAAAAVDIGDTMETGSQPYKPGSALVLHGQYAAQRGRAAEAVELIRRGIERLSADTAPDDTNLAAAYVALADQTARLGQTEDALALVRQGLVILRGKLPPGHSDIITATMLEARILAQAGQVEAGLVQARGTAQTLSDTLFAVTSRETERVSLGSALPAAFANYFEVARMTASDEEMLRALQLRLMSEQALTDFRIAAGSAERSAQLDAALARVKQARSRFKALEADLLKAQASGADTAAGLAAETDSARAALAQAESDLAREHPDFVALVAPSPASLASVQAALAPGQMLVLPLALADRVVSVGVTRDGLVTGEAPLGAEAVNALAQKVRASAEAVGRFDSAAAYDLFRAVFPEPLDALRREANEIILPASGFLARVSPALLLTRPPVPGEGLADAPWLVRDAAVTITGSVAGWVDSHKAGQASGAASNDFLGIGAVDSTAALASASERYRAATGGLPALPASLGELQAMQAAMRDGGARSLLTGSDASEAKLRAAQGRHYGVVAFATHGLVSGEVPGLAEPALVLAPAQTEGDTGDDGLLTASEIADLSLDADWVVLSACNTGSGSDIRAPAFSGLARAFRQAGARALMLSHWRVRDDAAARLSVDTVTGAAQGLSRAEALRRAQLALMQDTSVPDAAHPAIWAPFVIVEN